MNNKKYDEHNFIFINGSRYEIEENFIANNYLDLFIMTDGTEWYLASSSEEAGDIARDYWEDMAKQDYKEFICLVGEETLVSWALGQFAGPGYVKVNCLDDWLDLWLDTPEELFASYDGEEREYIATTCTTENYDINKSGVAYRHN